VVETPLNGAAHGSGFNITIRKSKQKNLRILTTEEDAKPHRRLYNTHVYIYIYIYIYIYRCIFSAVLSSRLSSSFLLLPLVLMPTLCSLALLLPRSHYLSLSPPTPPFSRLDSLFFPSRVFVYVRVYSVFVLVCCTCLTLIALENLET